LRCLRKEDFSLFLKKIPHNLQRHGSKFFIFRLEFDLKKIWPHLSISLLALMILGSTAFAKTRMSFEIKEAIKGGDLAALTARIDKYTPFLEEGESDFIKEVTLEESYMSLDEGYVLAYQKLETKENDEREDQDKKERTGEKQRTKPLAYLVKKGDTLIRLAQRFNLKVASIAESNFMKNSDFLRRGQTIYIPSVDGIVYKVKKGENISAIVIRFKGNYSKTLRANGLSVASKIYPGQRLTIAGGRRKIKTVTRLAKNSNSGYSQVGGSSARSTYHGSTKAYGRFIYPVGRGNCFNGYHWWAIDCPRPYWTPIHAADGGVVVKARHGYSGGYGNYVEINHGNGFATLYAHMIKLNVSLGQRVGQGQVIGFVGSTGRSLGSHLHFEIHVGGVRINPFRYL